MDKLEDKLYSISQADKYAFFGKVFEECQVALVNSDCVVKVRQHGKSWLKKYFRPYHSNWVCTIYKIDHYVVVWKGSSDIPIFIADFECPFDILPTSGYDFFLCKQLNGRTCFERYTWQPAKQGYLVEEMDQAPSSDEYLQVKKKAIYRDTEWDRIWPHEDIETRSVDNRIFYGFIVKYAQ